MNIDIIIFQWIHGLVGASVFIDYLGVFLARYFPFALVGMLVALSVRSTRWKLITFEAIVAALIARFGVVTIIRMLVQRTRPFVDEAFQALIAADPDELYGSFPSGHASFFFALSMVVWMHNKRLGYYLFGGSILMGVSRIFVGVHWPSDILAGALIGIGVAYFVHVVWKRKLE